MMPEHESHRQGAQAVFDLEVLDSGLLIGHDRDRVNTFRTGRHAYLQLFDPVLVDPPDPNPDPSCSVELDAADNPVLSWDQIPGNDRWQVRRDGSWLATIEGATTFGDTAAAPGAHSYVVRYRIDDNTTDLTCDPSPIVVPDDPGPGGQCLVVFDANGATIGWDDVDPDSRYQIRRDGSWVATTNGLTTYVDPFGAPGDTYVVRYRLDGSVFDLDCQPV